jgi:FixJ family two-component response regulator
MNDKKNIVLVVDDDHGVREALKFALELDGLTVHVCSSGNELLAHPELHRAQCLVLDYKMPHMDGFEVMERLAARRINLPVILIAGPVTDVLCERAAEAGIFHILEKPLLDDKLLNTIREAVHDARA